jgi:membrane protein
VRAVAWRALKTFLDHGLTDNAAALVYYAAMSLFPAVLFVVSLLGLVGDTSLASNAADYLVRKGADTNTAKTVKDALKQMINAPGAGVGVALVISLVLALNGASGAFAAAGRALNKVYGIKEQRHFVRRKLVDMGWTVLVSLLLFAVVVEVALGGTVAHDLLGKIGLSGGRTVWAYVRWPLAVATMILAFGVVYAFAPNVEPKRFRWLTPGAVTGVLIWIVASVGLSIYLKNFSKYGATYGAASFVIVLLLFLYVSAIAFLYGAEVNATLDRQRPTDPR